MYILIQKCGSSKHKYARFVSLHNIFYQKNTQDNHLLTFTFVICRLPVSQFARNAVDIDTSWLLIYFTILFKLLISKCH